MKHRRKGKLRHRYGRAAQKKLAFVKKIKGPVGRPLFQVWVHWHGLSEPPNITWTSEFKSVAESEAARLRHKLKRSS